MRIHITAEIDGRIRGVVTSPAEKAFINIVLRRVFPKRENSRRQQALHNWLISDQNHGHATGAGPPENIYETRYTRSAISGPEQLPSTSAASMVGGSGPPLNM